MPLNVNKTFQFLQENTAESSKTEKDKFLNKLFHTMKKKKKYRKLVLDLIPDYEEEMSSTHTKKG